MYYCTFCKQELVDEKEECPSCQRSSLSSSSLPSLLPSPKSRSLFSEASGGNGLDDGKTDVVVSSERGRYRRPLSVRETVLQDLAKREEKDTFGSAPPATCVVPLESSYFPPVPESQSDASIWKSAVYSIRLVRARRQRGMVIGTLWDELSSDTKTFDALLHTLGEAIFRQKREEEPFRETISELVAIESQTQDVEQQIEEATLQTEQALQHQVVRTETLAKIIVAAKEKVQTAKDSVKRATTRLRTKQDNLSRSQKNGGVQVAPEKAGHTRDIVNPLMKEIADSRADKERQQGILNKAKKNLDRLIADKSTEEKKHKENIQSLQAMGTKLTSLRDSLIVKKKRRLIHLGTLANLARPEDSVLTVIYQRVDNLRSSILRKESEIDRLEDERNTFDRLQLTRGILAMSVVCVFLLTSFVIVSIFV